jgi:hypothetical protein
MVTQSFPDKTMTPNFHLQSLTLAIISLHIGCVQHPFYPPILQARNLDLPYFQNPLLLHYKGP